jgi:hypothetical protein
MIHLINCRSLCLPFSLVHELWSSSPQPRLIVHSAVQNTSFCSYLLICVVYILLTYVSFNSANYRECQTLSSGCGVPLYTILLPSAVCGSVLEHNMIETYPYTISSTFSLELSNRPKLELSPTSDQPLLSKNFRHELSISRLLHTLLWKDQDIKI